MQIGMMLRYDWFPSTAAGKVSRPLIESSYE